MESWLWSAGLGHLFLVGKELEGLPSVLVGSEKTGGTSGTCVGGEVARHPIVHLVISIYSQGMLLLLGPSWLPRHCVPLVGSVQHCGMELPSLAIGGFLLCLP